jgi:hypothetical protein
MVKPQHAANIIHECAALLDLRLFRPPYKPSVILGGIQNDCTTEDLQLCLNKFGEIDEVSVDGCFYKKFCVLKFCRIAGEESNK